MDNVRLRPLSESHLPFVAEVRHHPLTITCLHDQRVFSADEMREWFERSRPHWYVIERDGERVGYVRTSDHDNRNRSIKIGADVHPAHRRQGLATAAYRTLFELLAWEGWHRVWLE